MIKRSFFTGLILLLPLIVTLFVLNIIINLLTSPFVGIFHQFLLHYELIDTSFSSAIESHLFFWTSKFIILLSLFLLIIFIGTLGQSLLVNSLLIKADAFLQTIPLVNKIYCSLREVVNTLFIQNSNSFSEAVLVPFPQPHVLSIGLVTGKQIELNHSEKKAAHVLVYIPTAPNPTVGYLLLFNSNQIIPLNISVEEAMKFVISCGTTLKNKP